MKEATNFGIKYLQTTSVGHQEYVMHRIIWRSRESAEKALEVLKGVVSHPELVEIWDPDEVKCLWDCPKTENVKAEEPLPEPDLKKDRHRSIFKSNPNGTVDIEIDGQKITEPWDPNQFPYPGWPIWLWDPRTAPWYTTTTGTGDNLRPTNNVSVG